MSLEWGRSSRCVTRPASGLSVNASAAATTAPQSATLVRPPTRTITYSTARPSPIHRPRLSEYTIGMAARASTTATNTRCRVLPCTHQPTTNQTSSTEALLPQALAHSYGASGLGMAKPSTFCVWAAVGWMRLRTNELPLIHSGSTSSSGEVKEKAGRNTPSSPPATVVTNSTPSMRTRRSCGSSCSVRLPR